MTCPKCERGGTGPHPKGCTVETRFWRKIRFVGACWEWQGALAGGYGRISLGYGRMVPAHRWIYEQVFGPVPEGLVVRHKCDNPRCVRPVHLEVGTHADNNRDMWERGRAKMPPPGPRSHCRRGHPMTPENVSLSSGHRECITCRRARQRALWHRKRIDVAETPERETAARATRLSPTRTHQLARLAGAGV